MDEQDKDEVFFNRGCSHVPSIQNKNDNILKKGQCKFDCSNWLNDIKDPQGLEKTLFAEVRFKNNHKDFFTHNNEIEIEVGDIVAVEASSGHDIGIVTLTNQTAKLQMKRKNISVSNSEIKKIYRKARSNDIEKWIEAVHREDGALLNAKKASRTEKLGMKYNDVEFQGDNSKAIFYYTADDRVDFRVLIKTLHEMFKIKIEMKQIGARQEASRIGGVGTCGRELCCASHLNNYKSVSTNAARVQQLSLNPQKLAGQCAKLKCCINYEYDVYNDMLKGFPDMQVRLKTKKGEAVFQNPDVLNNIMWYAYADNKSELMAIPIDKVKMIQQMNKEGKMPDNLEDHAKIKEVKKDNPPTREEFEGYDFDKE